MDSARTAPNLWRFANIEFDERSFELRVGGVSVDVERAPLRVLRELLETPRELVSREALLASVWKRKPETISRNALTNAIGKLRRAIGDEDQTLVVSSSGEGYRLEAEVERRALPPLQSLNQILKRGEPAPLRPNWVMRERIGSTDSSEVWIVEHPKTHERRVFKFAGDGFQLAALRREITISRLLREALGPRPEFVRIHDWNLEQPPYFIESDHGGADLGEWAAQQPGLDQRPLAERLRVIAELADAVALAHSVGALHKDLKPGNVLIDPEGRVRVVDFGSGRVLEPELLDQFQITRIALPEADPNTGTPFYIAPELLSGQAPTVASDVYSIGVLLYQFIVGDLQRPIAPGWESEIDDVLLREDIALAASGKPALRPAHAAGAASAA
jgi:non-specific serine/threonine protein kinase